ncbi:guanitoxin biosynthesis heme-dependent pre-guanitoxin N-hydroxylase GntA [Nocardia sp. NPDC049149]|uniref:guanitoxin biosynthesis heme-dependent pre-guanitoxin N-hydroxylase GntA n=1 Tax=Nocardia sp. NPDC049149 TaxID=3364315 RepID=UPI003711FB0F
MPNHSPVPDLFRDAVLRKGFPCVGARASVRNELCRVRVYPELGAPDTAAAVCRDLYEFAAEMLRPGVEFASFAAVFTGPQIATEAEFERLLWAHLQQLHDIDARRFAWDPETGRDPADPWFSFSVGARAYYVIGMHPSASRLARRFHCPVLVFNPHTQFARLRERGLLDTFKRRVRARDIALQGSVNPALLAAGSQAGQYSGRAVGSDWRCPFQPDPAQQGGRPRK